MMQEVARDFLVMGPMVYAVILFERRSRTFPESLRGVRFPTLGYFRRMRRDGRRIVHCQDIPDNAFGNPGKAELIVITSHRWLDRFTCEVATEERPLGLRLETMVDRLNECFPSLPFSLWRVWWLEIPLRLKFRRLASSFALGESDVLLFF